MNLISVNKQAYNNIDCIKVCMAVLVVATHTSFFSFIKSPEIYKAVFTSLSVKVPFFYAASGFLVWNKVYDASNEDKLCRLKGWICKTLRLYLIWTLIYMPFTIYGFYLDGLSPLKSIGVFFRNFLLVGQNFYSWQLWYLLGTLVAAIIVYLLIKVKCKLILMYCLAAVFAIIGILLDYCASNNYLHDLTSLYFKLFTTTRNGFFQGFPYIMIGISVANDGIIKSKGKLCLILLLAFIAHMLEFKLATFIMTYALFSLVIQFDLRPRQDQLYKHFRLASTVVYLVHMIWVGVFTFIIPIRNNILLFIVAIVMSFASAYLAIKFKESKVVRQLFR